MDFSDIVSKGSFWLTSRASDGLVDDFDLQGPRRATVLSTVEGSSPGAVLVHVVPDIAMEGRRHEVVLVWPLRRPSGGGRFVRVAVGPPSATSETDVMAWADGEAAASEADIPPTASERLEAGLQALERWMMLEGESSLPPDRKTADGVRLRGLFLGLKRKELEGTLADDTRLRLEDLPGWQWWTVDDVGLVERFVGEHGHLNIPPSLVVEDRRVLDVAQRLANRFVQRRESFDDTYTPPGGEPRRYADFILPEEDYARLRRLEPWEDFLRSHRMR
jgi:hypothetical protein